MSNAFPASIIHCVDQQETVVEFTLEHVNWLAILACVVAGQILLTVWFVVVFADPWAKAYGGEGMTRAEHTKAVPGYTYAIGAVCVFVLSLGLSLLQGALGVEGVGEALQLAGFLSVVIFVAMAMPAYAFLRRWRAFAIGAGSQLALIVVVSSILALWP
ncbi:MAG: hypothetical protein ACI8RZ_000303 [Myxococcota bacterium]|jgi:hypothetical protein